MAESKPMMTLINQPNVNKNTLFNHLIDNHKTIMHNHPSMTHDHHYNNTNIYNKPYTLINTNNFDPFNDDDMKKNIVNQLQVTLNQANVIVYMLNALTTPTSLNSKKITLLHHANKPIIYVANKTNSNHKEAKNHDLYHLNIDKLLFINTLHGQNMPKLKSALYEALPQWKPPNEDEADDTIQIAIISQPNTNKSSLINQLLDKNHMLVNDHPNTTHDPINSLIERKNKRYLFVNTTNLRHKTKVTKNHNTVKSTNIIQAMKAIKQAEVVILLANTAEKVAEQDTKILGLAIDRGRAIMVKLNKIDLLDVPTTKEHHTAARDVLSFMPWATFTRLSAKTGRGVDRLLGCVDKAYTSFNARVTTGELNRFFESVLQRHPPPTHGGRAPRFYYITQARTRPPTFVIVTSHPDNIHFSYQRYVVNAIREAFGFESVPVRVVYRRKDRKPKGRKRR